MRKGKSVFLALVLVVFLSFFIVNAIENPKNKVSKFYYKNLSFKEKLFYNRINRVVESRKTKIRTSFFRFDESHVKKILTFYFFENPQHFYLSKTYRIEENANKVSVVYLSYSLENNEYDYMQSEIEEVIDEIVKNVEGMDDYEKSSYVYKYLAKHNDYYKKGPFFNTMYGSMVLGKANCEGMSSAYMYIMNEVGIPTVQALGSINNKGIEENHSWNISFIDGKAFYTDTTFAINLISDTSVENDFYKYLNMSKEESLIERDIKIQKSIFGIY